MKYAKCAYIYSLGLGGLKVHLYQPNKLFVKDLAMLNIKINVNMGQFWVTLT